MTLSYHCSLYSPPFYLNAYFLGSARYPAHYPQSEAASLPPFDISSCVLRVVKSAWLSTAPCCLSTFPAFASIPRSSSVTSDSTVLVLLSMIFIGQHIPFSTHDYDRIVSDQKGDAPVDIDLISLSSFSFPSENPEWAMLHLSLLYT